MRIDRTREEATGNACPRWCTAGIIVFSIYVNLCLFMALLITTVFAFQGKIDWVWGIAGGISLIIMIGGYSLFFLCHLDRAGGNMVGPEGLNVPAGTAPVG